MKTTAANTTPFCYSWNRTKQYFTVARILMSAYSGSFWDDLENDKDNLYAQRFYSAAHECWGAFTNEDIYELTLSYTKANFPDMHWNWGHLKDAGLSYLIGDFCTDFRGRIIRIHQGFGVSIIEALRGDEPSYYNAEHVTVSHFTLTQALLCAIARQHGNEDAGYYMAKLIKGGE